LVIIIIVGVGGVLILSVPRLVARVDSELGDVEAMAQVEPLERNKRGGRKVRKWLVIILATAVISFIPLLVWAPWAVFVIIVRGLIEVNRTARVVPLTTPDEWSDFHARLVAFAALMALLGLLLSAVWLNPPPLDDVSIRPVQGAVRTGPLLAQGNGVIYIAEKRRRVSDGERGIIAIPLARVDSVRIGKGAWRYRPTVPEYLGIRLWRFAPNSGGTWQLKRSEMEGSFWKQLRKR
jgi:hypothetical protein